MKQTLFADLNQKKVSNLMATIQERIDAFTESVESTSNKKDFVALWDREFDSWIKGKAPTSIKIYCSRIRQSLSKAGVDKEIRDLVQPPTHQTTGRNKTHRQDWIDALIDKILRASQRDDALSNIWADAVKELKADGIEDIKTVAAKVRLNLRKRSPNHKALELISIREVRASIDDDIDSFLKKARECTTKRELGSLWRVELSGLKASHTVATCKVYASRYKKAFLAASGDAKLSMAIKLPKQTTRKVNTTYKKSIVLRHGNQIPFPNWKALLDNAISNLDVHQDSYMHLGLLLCLLTGRRPFEIFCTAEFSLVKNGRKTSNELLRFKGQAKTRSAKNSRDNYIIPVLHKSKLLLKHFNRFREINPHTGKSNKKFNRATSGRGMNRILIDLFGSNWPTDAKLVAKQLRPLYAEMAYKKSITVPTDYIDGRPENWTDIQFAQDSNFSTKNLYLSQILGHSVWDITTSNSYQHYRLPD